MHSTHTIVIIQKDGTLATGKCAQGVDVVKHAPQIANGQPYEILPDADLPKNYEFRDAWTMLKGVVSVDLVKAKVLSHDARRNERLAAFKPLDDEFALYANKKAMGITLTAKESKRALAIEAERVVIRDKDALKQIAIDSAKTEAELLAAYHG